MKLVAHFVAHLQHKWLMCLCTLNAKTTQHFLLNCPPYNDHRLNYFQTVNLILLMNNINHLNDSELVRILLYGYEKLPHHANQTILKKQP